MGGDSFGANPSGAYLIDGPLRESDIEALKTFGPGSQGIASSAQICRTALAPRHQTGHHEWVPMDEHTAPPDVIRRYLEAHDRRDTDGALSAFARDARVLDDGHEYQGRDAIRDWLERASTQFTYTRTLLDATAEAPNLWLVGNRLEGNSPGGVVDLRYRFMLVDGLIADLAIVP